MRKKDLVKIRHQFTLEKARLTKLNVNNRANGRIRFMNDRLKKEVTKAQLEILFLKRRLTIVTERLRHYEKLYGRRTYRFADYPKILMSRRIIKKKPCTK
jgi:hypothetical protein